VQDFLFFFRCQLIHFYLPRLRHRTTCARRLTDRSLHVMRQGQTGRRSRAERQVLAMIEAVCFSQRYCSGWCGENPPGPSVLLLSLLLLLFLCWKLYLQFNLACNM
jgi:hypothetical protein